MENNYTQEELELVLLQGEIAKHKDELNRLWNRKYSTVDDSIEMAELTLSCVMGYYTTKLKEYKGDRVMLPAHKIGSSEII